VGKIIELMAVLAIIIGYLYAKNVPGSRIY